MMSQPYKCMPPLCSLRSNAQAGNEETLWKFVEPKHAINLCPPNESSSVNSRPRSVGRSVPFFMRHRRHIRLGWSCGTGQQRGRKGGRADFRSRRRQTSAKSARPIQLGNHAQLFLSFASSATAGPDPTRTDYGVFRQAHAD